MNSKSAFVTPHPVWPSKPAHRAQSTSSSPVIRRRLPTHRISLCVCEKRRLTSCMKLSGRTPATMSRSAIPSSQTEPQRQSENLRNMNVETYQNTTAYNKNNTLNKNHINSINDDQSVWRKQNAVLVSEAQRKGVDAALQMLWKLDEQGDAVVQNFNQLVSLFASFGRFEDGLKLAEYAGSRGLANIITFRPLMKLCCTLGDGRGAKRVWNLMLTLQVEGDMFLYAELMGAVVRSQDMTSAYKIIASITESGLQPHVILYNTLMKEFARRADVASGFEILKTIEKAGVKPDETTFNTLLNICVRAMDVDALQHALSLMNEHNIKPGTPTFNTILKLYARKGKFDKALTIFEEMQQSVQPSIVTYNTLIDGCAHRGDMERASIFFDRMNKSGFTPDICTLTSLLKGFGRSNNPQKAVQLYEAMLEGGYKIEERTRYAVINACLRGKDRHNARRFLRDMRTENILVRTRTWTWMLHCDALARDENGALETLGLMYSNGTCLDASRKAALIRDIRETGGMPQLLRQLKAARVGESRN